MAKQGYSLPKLYSYGGDLSKEWYVGFRHTCPSSGLRKPFQIRNGINFRPTNKDRIEEAVSLISVLSAILNEGWNPHNEDMATYLLRTRDSTELLPNKPFNDALDFALESKKQNLASKSYRDILGVKEFIKIASKKLHLHSMPIKELKRSHVKLLLEQLGKDRQSAYDKDYRAKLAKGNTNARHLKWTGNSYNKYRNFFQILLSELVEYEALEYNPCDKISTKPEMSTNLHRHATDIEKEKIKLHLEANYPELYIYLVAEFMTGIRPLELCGLQVENYDPLNQCFHIQHSEGKSKTRKSRMVPIPNSFMPYLSKLNIEAFPSEYFIFGKGFKPGALRERRENITQLWKRVVKDELGVNVSLYSFKGLGGEAKRRAGLSAGAISAQYGHSSMNMTMRYLHGEQDRINRDIIEHTPDF